MRNKTEETSLIWHIFIIGCISVGKPGPPSPWLRLCSMISILPKKTLYMTDIICTETILYWQEATIFHSIPNKACKDANMILNDDVIDFKFWNKFLPNANKSQRSTDYDSRGHCASVDMSLASVFQKQIFPFF